MKYRLGIGIGLGTSLFRHSSHSAYEKSEAKMAAIDVQ
jgi:hypothetical protein